MSALGSQAFPLPSYFLKGTFSDSLSLSLFNLHGDADIILMTFLLQSFPSDFPLPWDAVLIAQLTSVLVTTWHQTVGSSMHFLQAIHVLPCQFSHIAREQNIHPAVTSDHLSTDAIYLPPPTNFAHINISLFAGISNHHKACLVA